MNKMSGYSKKQYKKSLHLIYKLISENYSLNEQFNSDDIRNILRSYTPYEFWMKYIYTAPKVMIDRLDRLSDTRILKSVGDNKYIFRDEIQDEETLDEILERQSVKRTGTPRQEEHRRMEAAMSDMTPRLKNRRRAREDARWE